MLAPRSPSSLGVLPLEIGALSTLSSLESQFFGSSSGVFFVNRVLRAFTDARSHAPLPSDTPQPTESPGHTSVNECLAESSDDAQIQIDLSQRPVLDSAGTDRTTTSYGQVPAGLGQLPNISVAKELVMTYFELWHPLFPFLHGPSFLLELESLYASESMTRHRTPSEITEDTCRAVLFQSIFNLAIIDRSDIVLPPESRIKSKSTLMSILGILAVRNETPFIQAMLAAQIFLMGSMSLNAASIVGGMVLRKIYQAGFHRCPFRYMELSQHDCDMRKRIFWCVYATDRYLSQALGHPLGFQDLDVDVCMPGSKELHMPVPRVTQTSELCDPGQEILLHLPDGHPDHPDLIHLLSRDKSIAHHRKPNSSSDIVSCQSEAEGSTPPSQTRGDQVLASYVAYGRIVGHALELFHKSIHNRTMRNSDILLLKAEVHSWWNHLPSDLQEPPPTAPRQSISPDEELNDTEFSFAPFFIAMYQQLILLVNRPFLSSDPSTPEFKSSLQVCVGASRRIISTFQDRPIRKQCLSAPGILSATWMAGLVIAFACELNAYPTSKGFLEIESCLRLLQMMGERWNSARCCRNILGILLSNLRTRNSRRNLTNQQTSDTPQSQSGPRNNLRRTRSMVTAGDQESNKRQRVVTSESANTNQVGNFTDHRSYLPNSQLDNNFDSTGQSSFQPNDLQMPDIFSQVSWEALFPEGDFQAENTGQEMSFS